MARISQVIKKKIFKTLVYFALFSIYSIRVDAAWESVPLTTENQLRQGIHGGEGFQQVMAITYAPSNPNIIVIGTDTARIWKSQDGGRSWFVSSHGMDTNGACSVFIFPDNEKRMLAAGCLGPKVSRAIKNKYRREGIYLSEDGGNSWQLVFKTSFFKQESKGQLFAAYQVKGKWVVFCGTYSDGVIVSYDNGVTWKKKYGSLKGIRDIASIPDKKTVLVACKDGLFKIVSDKSVQRIGEGLPKPPTSIAIAGKAGTFILAASDGRIYKSIDDGDRFFSSSSGLYPKRLSFISDVFISMTRPYYAYATTRMSSIKGPYYSFDGGKSWKLTKTINADNLIDGKGFWFSSPIGIHPRYSNIAIAASNGKTRIVKTTDGGRTWRYSGSGYTGARVVDMAFVSSSNWYVALTDHGLWQTTNNGRSFKPIIIPGARLQSIGSISVYGNRIVVSVGGWKKKSIAISRDSGKHWKTLRRVHGSINFIRTHSGNPSIIYASMYRSDDGGKSWMKLEKNVMAVNPNNNDIVYSIEGNTVYISSNRGEHWKLYSTCKHMYGVNKVDVSIKNGVANIFIAANSGLYVSKQGRCYKTSLNSGISPDSHGLTSFRTVLVDPIKKNIVYAGRWAPGRGASTGILISRDNAVTWHRFNVGMPDEKFDVWSISVNPYSHDIFAGTTFGLYRYRNNGQ